MEGNGGRTHLAAGAVVNPHRQTRKTTLKATLSVCLATLLRPLQETCEGLRRILSHARLASQLRLPLPASVVVLGRTWVYGTGAVRFGEDALLYPEVHLETQDDASIAVGDRVVLSRGVHLVAMSGITIGEGSMIGEYTSIRDANHRRQPGQPLRDAGHVARPVRIGKQVWIGRGVAILAGVTIGDHATIGANAVVTRDVAAGSVVGGVPAAPLRKRS